MKKHIIIFILFSFISFNGFANQAFKVVVGHSKPPYVIEESQSGFELELMRQLLTLIGKEAEFIFIPYGRSEKMLSIPDISAVMTATQQMFPNIKTLSESYIDYQNVAISLKKNTISLNRIADLGNYSIASFQLAHKLLGEEFALAVAQSSMFIQVANQERQVELLVHERVDVVVMDIKIFLHHLAKLRVSKNLDDIKFHHIFPISRYSVAFKNSADVAAFNQALADFITTDKYQQLVEKYNFETQN